MNLRLVRCVVVLFSIALVARPAQAQGKRESGQKLTEQGRRAYNLGHWSDALADFEKAYEVSGNPLLLFNLAETHRQLGHTADALRLYNAYLRELPNGPEHEAAATEIKNLGGATAAKSPPAPPAKQATAPPPASSPPPVATAPAKPAPLPAVTTAPAKPAPTPVVATAPAKPAPPPAAKPAPTPPPLATAPAKPAPATSAAATPPPVATAPAKSAPPAASNSAPAPVVTIAPASTSAAVAPAAPLPAAAPPTLVSQAPAPAAHRSRWPVIVGGAATGALAVGAIAFTVSGNHLYDDLKGSCGNTTAGCTQGQVDGVKTRDHAATAFWILAGAAAIATSVVLVVRF